MLARPFVIVLLAASLVAPAAFANPAVLASRVDSVTVFPNGVAIHRTGSTRVAAGSQQVVLGPLPTALADETIRIGGFGPGVTAESVTVRPATMAEVTGVEIGRLAAALAATTRQRAALAERRPALVRAAGAEQGSGHSRAAAALADLDRRLNEIERRVAAQTQAVAQARQAGQQAIKLVAIDLSSADVGEMTLSIEYMVPNAAAWRPSYAARLDAAGARVGLDLFATVQQQTGEDWRDVSLAVSSVVPASGLALPQFEEWSVELVPQEQLAAGDFDAAALGAAVPRPARAMPRTAAGMPNEPQAELPIARRPPAPIEQSRGVAAPNLLAARLHIPGHVTIRSGAAPRRVLAAHADLETTLEYQAAPRQSSSVFLAARFRNANPFPLLAGPAALFVGTDYVGTTALGQTPIDEEVLLPFGVDAGVTIDRTLADRSVGQSNGRNQTTLRWQLRLTNHRDRPIDVTVLDQLPVSRSAGLTVATIAGSRPAEAHHESDPPGVLRWRIHAAAGETKRWTFGYTVSVPRNRALDGEVE